MTTAKTPAKTTTRKPAAKKPQDRKPKAVEVDETAAEREYMARKRIVTVDGIPVTVTFEFLMDYEFAEASADAEDGEYRLVPRLINRVVGGDRLAHTAIKEHLRDETGLVDLIRGAEFFQALMGAVTACMKAEQDAEDEESDTEE